jgi:hypothetical protein
MGKLTLLGEAQGGWMDGWMDIHNLNTIKTDASLKLSLIRGIGLKHCSVACNEGENSFKIDHKEKIL